MRIFLNKIRCVASRGGDISIFSEISDIINISILSDMASDMASTIEKKPIVLQRRQALDWAEKPLSRRVVGNSPGIPALF